MEILRQQNRNFPFREYVYNELPQQKGRGNGGDYRGGVLEYERSEYSNTPYSPPFRPYCCGSNYKNTRQT